jgi:alpha-L-fucosidase
MTGRRDFLKQVATAGTGMLILPPWLDMPDHKTVPPHLWGHADLFIKDPHQAALSWFSAAGFGLFMHYGLYSLLGRGEWVQLEEKIPVAEYEQLKKDFTAENFNPDLITDVAIAAGMKYVTFTAKHHDGFCLFKTNQTRYNSVHSPAKRDLVRELKKACDKKGLGLFLYYSIAADWHHPYFASSETGWGNYRPAYAAPQPAYAYTGEADFQKYLVYARAQLRELVTQYRPAGIWFDPITGFYARPDLFPMDNIYAEIRSLCPHTLIAFKQGATGTEDFAAPERGAGSFAAGIGKSFGARSGLVAEKAWEGNQHKHNETCNTLQSRKWGYSKAEDGKHKNAEQVLALLQDAKARNMNLLLNTGPLPDGSLPPEDVKTLRETGRLAGLKQ